MHTSASMREATNESSSRSTSETQATPAIAHLPVDLYGMQRKMSAITLTQIGRYVATGAWMTYLRTCR